MNIWKGQVELPTRDVFSSSHYLLSMRHNRLPLKQNGFSYNFKQKNAFCFDSIPFAYVEGHDLYSTKS